MSFVNNTTLAMAGPGNSTTTQTSTDAGLIGLGLSLPDALHHVTASNGSQGRFPGVIQRPKKPLVRLGLGLPTDENQSTITVERPTVGLGIYVPGSPQWPVVDDREEEDEQTLLSPPLLPTRRESPYRVGLGVILDDDEFPPPCPIFTPAVLQEETPGVSEVEEWPFFTTRLERPAFMNAPSASELPTPRFPQQTSGAGLGIEVDLISFETDDDDEPTPSSGNTSSSEPGTPRTPYVFQSSPSEMFGSGGENHVSEESPFHFTVFSPTPVPATETEAYYHLPSNLLDSPDSVASYYKGLMDRGVVFESTFLGGLGILGAGF